MRHRLTRSAAAIALLLTAACLGSETANGPTVVVTPDEVDFGDVPVGVTALREITIANGGSGPLRIHRLNVRPEDGPFVVNGHELTVPAGAARTIELTYSPVAADEAWGQLTIASDADNDTDLHVLLGGRGVASDAGCEAGEPGCLPSPIGACGGSAAGMSCRAASDECDVAEVCDGATPDCPADVALPDGMTCSVGTCQAGSCLPSGSISAYYKLDDVDVRDFGAGGHDGSLVGMPTLAPGQFGGALRLDGEDDHISVPDFDYGSDFTIALWFNTQEGGDGYLLSHGDAETPNSVAVWLEDRELRSYVQDAEGNVLFWRVPDVERGRWHLYTLVHEHGVGTRVYLDGGLRGFSTEVAGRVDPTTPIALGARQDGVATFAGRLDEVRFYDEVASAVDLWATAQPGASIEVRPEADASIRGGAFSDENYGEHPLLIIKNETSPDYCRRALLRFDLEGLADVTSAVLRLHVRRRGVATEIGHEVALVAEDGWDEGAISWSNAPAAGDVLAAYTVPIVDDRIEVDLTAATREAIATDGLLSLRISAPTYNGSEGWTEFHSRQGLLPPALVITPR